MTAVTATQLNIAIRVQRAFELRLRRMPYRDIAETIRRESRETHVNSLRLQGMSLAQIELEISLNGYPNSGYNFQAVGRDLSSEMKALRRVSLESAREYRELELEYLDKIAESIYDAAMNGDYFAIDRLLKISDQRCKLLGLYNTIDIRMREIIEQRLEAEFNGFFAKINDDPKIPEHVKERLMIIAGLDTDEEDCNINYENVY